MKMSAAHIRSLFRRQNSAQEQVFRLSRNVARPCFPAAPSLRPVGAIEPQPSPARLAVLDQHYQTAMKRELAKINV